MPRNNSRIKKPDHFPRIAIITGATSGIGEAIARRLINSGFGVVGNGRNTKKLELLAKELGDAFCPVDGDAADPALQDKLFECAISHFNKQVSLVVANAGRGLGGSVVEADLSQFEDVVKINLTGTLSLLQKAAKKFLSGLEDRPFPEHAADIVVIGSVVGRNVSPFSAVYGSTKFAINSLAEGLRREIGPKGIRVSLIEPGIVLSGFQKIAGYDDRQMQTFHDKFDPMLEGDDIARTVEFIVNLPPHIQISDIVIRPTRQDYP